MVEADFARVHVKLRRKGVTLMLLWQEYRAALEGRRTWAHTQFCEHYKALPQDLEALDTPAPARWRKAVWPGLSEPIGKRTGTSLDLRCAASIRSSIKRIMATHLSDFSNCGALVDKC